MLWLLILLVVEGCAVTPAPGPPTPALPRPTPPPRSTDTSAEQRTAFAAAESLRSRKAYPQALEAFAYFVQRYAPNPLTDDALLAAGQIATLLGDMRRAQGFYQSLLANFPASELASTASLELGIVLYNTQNYERSRVMLQQYLETSLAPARQAIAHYYLGLMARAQQRYSEAITALLQSTESSADPEVTAQARSELAQIVRQQLSQEQLVQLAEQYGTTYPGDLMLLQLAQQYRDAGDEAKEIETLQRFSTDFPAHPNLQEAQARLQELQPPPAPDAPKIGVLLPLSGAGGFYGQRALQGVELAFGILQERQPSMPLSLVVRDSQASPEVASAALQELAADTQVMAVIGPLFSQVATILAPLAEQLGIPLVTPYAPEGDFPTRSTYVFRNTLTDALQSRFLADYAMRVLGLRRFAILHANDDYGNGLKDAFVAQVTQRQGEIVGIATYPPDATDFSQPILSLGGADDETRQDLRAQAGNTTTTSTNPPGVAARPFDALFLPDYYDRVGLIAPTLALYNITNVQLLGTDGWNVPELVQDGEQALEGAVFVDGFFVDSPAVLVQDFVKRFRSRYEKKPDLLTAQAYDSLFLLAQVLSAGATSREQIRDGLRQIRNFPGVSGTTSMNVHGEADKIPYLLSVRGGRIVQLN
jgi:ABC-type branched-subunit amino acid transport system substrate-binding protein